MSKIPHQRRFIAVDPKDHSMTLETGPVPSPKSGEVLIKVSAAGLNRADLLQRQGLYPPPEDASPIMGLEVAGEIIATGAEVSNWQVGDEVCALTHGGGYADYTVAPATQCLPIPASMDMTEAAALPEAVLTVWHNLFQRCRLQAGETVVSDLMVYPVQAFKRLGVSFYAPGLTPQVTRHLNANEVLYLSLPGDHAANADGSVFVAAPEGYTANFLVIEALEVLARPEVSTVVAVGDSITDGSDSTTALLSGRGSPLVATDQRYPNHLQRRFNDAGMPFTVANAGIGGNELLRDGWLPQFGKSLLARFDADVLQTQGVSHVLVMIGTNDFGNPKPGQAPTSEALIAGYQELIAKARNAGLKIILGTIPPAQGTVTELVPVLHGTTAATRSRDEANAWIRSQHLSDGVVDFEKCLEDKNRAGFLAEEYNSGDNLHPNPAGYAAMADCVNLNLFRN